jgi:hypothetical protein
MNVKVEGRHPSEFIVSEANGRRSREAVTVAAGANLEPGTVVGRLTANGKVVAYNPTIPQVEGSPAPTGAETIYGILIYPADAATADVTVAAIARDAEVNGELIVWPNGFTSGQIATGKAGLEARNIIVR